MGPRDPPIQNRPNPASAPPSLSPSLAIRDPSIRNPDHSTSSSSSALELFFYTQSFHQLHHHPNPNLRNISRLHREETLNDHLIGTFISFRHTDSKYHLPNDVSEILPSIYPPSRALQHVDQQFITQLQVIISHSQATVESATFGSEFTAARIACDQIRHTTAIKPTIHLRDIPESSRTQPDRPQTTQVLPGPNYRIPPWLFMLFSLRISVAIASSQHPIQTRPLAHRRNHPDTRIPHLPQGRTRRHPTITREHRHNLVKQPQEGT
jgi:hypothetical protein